MKEPEVIKYLENYLVEKDIPYRNEFPLLSGGRIDYLSFYWKNNHEISINGYECKGDPSPYSAAKIIRDQIVEYQKAIPKTYFVVGSSRINELKILCHVNSVGLINIGRNGKIEIVEDVPDERNLYLEDEGYKPLRTICAMFLGFEEKFGNNLRRGTDWCSTPEPNDETQFNIAYDIESKSVYFSINLENAKKVLRRIDIKQLQAELVSLPNNYWINSGITTYYVPRRGIYTKLIYAPTSVIETVDLKYLKEKAQDNIVYIQIRTEIWNCDEILPKQVHLSRINSAKNQLSNIRDMM